VDCILKPIKRRVEGTPRGPRNYGSVVVYIYSPGVPESWVSPGTQLGADDRSNDSNAHFPNSNSQGVTFKTAAVLDLSTPKRASKEDAGRLR